MNRRFFLGLLSLPFVAPLARWGHALLVKIRKPRWWLQLNMQADAPFEVEIASNTAPTNRIAFPANSGFCFIPMYSPMPRQLRVTVRCNGPLFRFYGLQLDHHMRAVPGIVNIGT